MLVWRWVVIALIGQLNNHKSQQLSCSISKQTANWFWLNQSMKQAAHMGLSYLIWKETCTVGKIFRSKKDEPKLFILLKVFILHRLHTSSAETINSWVSECKLFEKKKKKLSNTMICLFTFWIHRKYYRGMNVSSPTEEKQQLNDLFLHSNQI